MFSNRSIKDLSLGNFQKFKILNQDSQIRSQFQSERLKVLSQGKPSLLQTIQARKKSDNRISKNFFSQKQSPWKNSSHKNQTRSSDGKIGVFSLGAIQTMQTDQLKLAHLFNNQVSESTVGRHRTSESKAAHCGEPDDDILAGAKDLDSAHKDKNFDMPKQLPDLEQSPQNFDLLSRRPDGCDTPKFNEDSFQEENKYVKKRIMLQARKDFYAQENYRSETTSQLNPSQQHIQTSSQTKTISHTNVIRSMDCRVKQIRPSCNPPALRGHYVSHQFMDSMQGSFIAPGLSQD